MPDEEYITNWATFKEVAEKTAKVLEDAFDMKVRVIPSRDSSIYFNLGISKYVRFQSDFEHCLEKMAFSIGVFIEGTLGYE